MFRLHIIREALEQRIEGISSGGQDVTEKQVDQWEERNTLHGLLSLATRQIHALRDAPYCGLLHQVEALQNVPPSRERTRSAQELFRELIALVTRDTLHHVNTNEEPTNPVHVRDIPKLLPDCYAFGRLRRSQYEPVHTVTADISWHLSALLREDKILRTIGHADEKKFQRELPLYGSKGARMEQMRAFASRVALAYHQAELIIPPFMRLPVSLFHRWKQDKSIHVELQASYAWIAKRPIWVRSSGVHAEDSPAYSGAGMYESVFLQQESTFEQYAAAVETVYRSVESNEAQRRRNEQGITREEEMGIVLQEAAPGWNGTANSVRPYAPDLVEVVSDSARAIFKREGMYKALYHDVSHLNRCQSSDVLYYGIDGGKTSRRKRIFHSCSVADIALLAEHHFGFPLQMESCFSDDRDQRQIFGLQVRPLPSQVLRTYPVTFPDTEPIMRFDAIGIDAGTEYDLLDRNTDNRHGTGVVIFENSHQMGWRKFSKFLPQRGAVVVLQSDEVSNAHIETYCAENGIALLFCSPSSNTTWAHNDPDGEDRLRTMKKVRVFMNGMEGRIYPPES